MWCRLWVNVLTPSIAPLLAGNLVEMGYQVRPCASDGAIVEESRLGGLIALEVHGAESTRELNDDVEKCLGDYTWFCIIVQEDRGGSASWTIGGYEDDEGDSPG